MRDDEPLVAEARDVRDEALEWADRRIAELARGRVLDAGCGEGRFLRDGWYGVDVDRARLRFARLRSALVACADVHALPFADGAFEAALASRMLNAAGRIDEALLELRRVLRHGGTLLVLTLAGASDSQLQQVDDAVRQRQGRRRDDRLDEANGADRLSRFFEPVEAERFARRFRFDDHASALDHYAGQYLHRGDPDPAEMLERFERARELIARLAPPILDEQRATLFVARKL